MKFNNKNVTIHNDVKIGSNVEIGDNTTIYPNVIIGDNTIIANDCVIGEPINDYYRKRLEYVNPPTKIGSDSLIRSHTIIYCNSEFGNHLTTGHRVTIREKTIIGNHSSVGSYCDIQGDCVIGNYSRLHSYVNVGQKAKIGSFVFIYPYVTITNDLTPPSRPLKGVFIGDYTQIGTNSTLLSTSKINQSCLVAAGSIVFGEYENDSFISGNPAKRVGKLSKMPFFNDKGNRNYPWQKHFSEGLPWAEIGFEDWSKLQNDD
ncbi:N-acetyltransferase [Flammeovirga pectinis]|uniref:N-acetyltransferase n=1 Tax=Flammeovirga pectinis TaxID=2494373 RepID=A0A3S9P160_9BACT|nr:N-acetyltransferase [Flammeovirga pectinis]AZQ61912.1 N-acetyltransferase [Flammeovirga pectinis]